MSAPYKLGSGLDQYRPGEVFYADFILTEDCNLRCQYCYLSGKTADHPMSIQVARDAVDFFLRMPTTKSAVVWNMIGGEALIAMDVIEDIVKYIKVRTRELRHPWEASYGIMLSTNGVLYAERRVQEFLYKNRHHVYPAITLDGTKRKHDMHRRFPDGSGSYDIVAESMRLALRQFPYLGTKVTFSHGDLPYVCESIVHLWEMGIISIAANCVFEDVWHDGDPEVYESQLKMLADTALDKGFWRTHKTNLFWEPSGSVPPDRNSCGTGKGASVDWRGDIHGCIRFCEHSLAASGRPTRPIGSIYRGFYPEVMRAFDCLRKSVISQQQCLECEMQEDCSWCAGHCYEVAPSETMFHRAVYICDMHKARWRANQYYWAQLEALYGVKPTGNPRGRDACVI